MSDDNETDSGPLSPERARQIILRRRARFVAAALAGISAAGCDSSLGPQVCLSLVGPDAGAHDAGSDAGPQVCLSPPDLCDDALPPDPECPVLDAGTPGADAALDAGDDAGCDAGADAGCDAGPDAAAPDAGPQVCLSLTMVMEPDDELKS